MLKRTVSLILTFITLLSLLSIALTPTSATKATLNAYLENVDVTNGKFPVADGYHTVVYEDLLYMKSVYISASGTGEFGTEYWGSQWPGKEMKYAFTNTNGNKVYVAYVPEKYTMYTINNNSAKTTVAILKDNVGIYINGTNSQGYWTLDMWSPEFYEYETKQPITTEPNTSTILPPQTTETPTTTAPHTELITKPLPTHPITSPVITKPTTLPIANTTVQTVVTHPIIPTESTDNTEVITTDPIEETTVPIQIEPAEKLSTTINVLKSSEGKYKVSANATGGSGNYKYQFSVNNILCQDFSDKSYCTYLITHSGNYTFYVTVKDSTGSTISTDTTIVVTIDSENTTEHTNSTYPSIPIIEPTETKTTIPVLDFSSDPTTTTKAEATTASVDKGLLGDVTTDSKVNIRDATAIQKHLAKIKLLSDDALLLADFDQNEKLNIKDATTIQKFIAGLIEDGAHIHKYNKTVVSPSCTDKGYTLYECLCGNTYKDNWTNAKHSYSANGICKKCGVDHSTQLYKNELDQLTLEYNNSIADLQKKINDCISSINSAQNIIDSAQRSLQKLSPTCPYSFIMQYINSGNYVTSVDATQAATAAWSKQYNSQKNQLNNTITEQNTKITNAQTNIDVYNISMSTLTTQYNANVNNLKIKYSIP